MPALEELQRIVDRLSERADIEPPRVMIPKSPRWAGTFGHAYEQDDPVIIVGPSWWSRFQEHGLCRCEHSQKLHRESDEGVHDERFKECLVKECACANYTDDGTERNVLVQQSLEATLAHEVAHGRQHFEGWPREESFKGEFDADERAVKILGDGEQLIRALRLAAGFEEEDSKTHPPIEERVRKIQERFQN